MYKVVTIVKVSGKYLFNPRLLKVLFATRPPRLLLKSLWFLWFMILWIPTKSCNVFVCFFNPFLFFTIAVKKLNERYFLRIPNERYEVLRIPTVSLWGVQLIYGIAGYCNRVKCTTWKTKVLKYPQVNDWS